MYTGGETVPSILPQSGTIFLRKSRSVHEVFFSSLGKMHETCADLPLNTETEVQQPDQDTLEEESDANKVESERRDNPDLNKVEKDENDNILENDPLESENISSREVSMEPDSLNPLIQNQNISPLVHHNSDDSESNSIELSLGSSLENESRLSDDEGSHLIDKDDGEVVNEGDKLSLTNYISLESSPPSPPTSSTVSRKERLSSQQQEHLTQISQQSLSLFQGLDKWKIVHFSRAATWILERVRETEENSVGWNCVVGETGSFHFSVTSSNIHEISIDHITVLLFNTNNSNEPEIQQDQQV